MRLARRTVLRPKLGAFRPQTALLLCKHLHTTKTAPTTAPLRTTFTTPIRHHSTKTEEQTNCASCNIPFQITDESQPGFFVPPKKIEVKKDTDRFNALIENMSAENLEFLAREQNLVSHNEPFDVSEARKNYTEKVKLSGEAPRVCQRCHDVRHNTIDERVPYVLEKAKVREIDEDTRSYNQAILDTLTAEADTATVFLTCSIHEFPANVPVFLRKRRNLKLVLTKAEGVIYVPQVNSVNIQMWAAAQMQSLGFKMAAEDVHFFSAERDKSGGHHQFSMYDLQREKNAFIVGYPNSGKTSLFNILTEEKFSKEANDLRYALPKDSRVLKKWNNVSWHPEHTLEPCTRKTVGGKITDMPAFKRVNSPWGLVDPARNSYLTDKMLLTENARKFAGSEVHLKRNQVAYISGLFGVESHPDVELLVWTSIPGKLSLAKHTNAAKAHMISQAGPKHERAQWNLLDSGRPNMPPLTELGTATFDQDDGIGLEVAFEGAGFARIKRTGRKDQGKPTATIWGFPGQVFAFRQPLCEIMMNNEATVKGFFGLKDPNWKHNRRPIFNYKVDFEPTANVEQLGGPDSLTYRVKDDAHTQFSQDQLLRAKRADPRKTAAHKVERELKLNNRPRPAEGDEFLTVEDLEVMDAAKDKIRAKQGTSTKKLKKKKDLIWTKVGSSKNIKSWKWLTPEDAKKYAHNQDPDCKWFKQKHKGRTFQEVMGIWEETGRLP
ncbi:hypothetical protein CJU89_6519 [Yarrowia sp. B02]|nr:hypothetical protein CJU89_6519 [Yarrowia sp. B02]